MTLTCSTGAGAGLGTEALVTGIFKIGILGGGDPKMIRQGRIKDKTKYDHAKTKDQTTQRRKTRPRKDQTRPGQARPDLAHPHGINFYRYVLKNI
jgi:hypothetical protein